MITAVRLHIEQEEGSSYLSSVGAPLLGTEAPSIVGLSVETTCFVSAGYFEDDDPFADFVVHEVAHVFHNCKRGFVGLPQTGRREWLLDIEFGKRETFAYSCEVYSCIARARSRRDRLALAGQYEQLGRVHDARAPHAEVADIVREACAARERVAHHPCALQGSGGTCRRGLIRGRLARRERWAAFLSELFTDDLAKVFSSLRRGVPRPLDAPRPRSTILSPWPET
jgi:hypothetical protein